MQRLVQRSARELQQPAVRTFLSFNRLRFYYSDVVRTDFYTILFRFIVFYSTVFRDAFCRFLLTVMRVCVLPPCAHPFRVYGTLVAVLTATTERSQVK